MKNNECNCKPIMWNWIHSIDVLCNMSCNESYGYNKSNTKGMLPVLYKGDVMKVIITDK